MDGLEWKKADQMPNGSSQRETSNRAYNEQILEFQRAIDGLQLASTSASENQSASQKGSAKDSCLSSKCSSPLSPNRTLVER